MFIGQGAGGLPEDRIVNTFHFNNALPYLDHVNNLSVAMPTFYNEVGNGENIRNLSLSAQLSPWVQREAEFRFYDMSLPKGEREPLILPTTLTAAQSSGGLPEEVALCLSYTGDPPITPRRRGRIYFGPIAANTDTEASATNPSRPVAILIQDLMKAGRELASYPTTTIGWSIHSSVPNDNYVYITRGWVDDAWDTQRRRGPDASTRTTWAATAG